MAGKPDPKPEPRRKDPEARRVARLVADECAACGLSDVKLSVHHILYGRDGRDDDPRNMLVVCGDGVLGCHGDFHHGDPDAKAALARAIAAAPEKVAFVEDRLGREAGRDYLLRRYGLVLAA